MMFNKINSVTIHYLVEPNQFILNELSEIKLTSPLESTKIVLY